ncbi:annexin A9 isoform X2 [Dermochelys coriacea]|uniref:annexin A9 isoform X2 n=1 Tax=Dermochelys coriacea TaxID=27794 RepID=UPI0018E7B552|nr:annexin A9 isoform X2 [Dermochelys coriacea]
MLLGDGMDRHSLAHEILSQLPLAQQTAAWGTLGTIKPYLGFDVESDVQHLIEAITGNGADHGAILDVLTNRTSAQRQQITKVFQALTKQDLLKSMEAALSGNLERVIVGLLKLPAQYDAHELRAAMQGMGTDEDALTEILSTRSNQQLREILAFYQQDFKADPEKDIASETSSWFKEILLALAKGKRERNTGIIDYALIQQDAKALADPGASSEGAGERTWISIFTQRSPEHLSRVFGQYQKSHGLEVEETICKRFQGDGQAAMLALASVCRNTPRYFAEKLHNALKVETRGDYQAALLALCRAEDL